MNIAGTIPEALLAIADAIVRMELLRISTPRACKICDGDFICYWCRTNANVSSKQS